MMLGNSDSTTISQFEDRLHRLETDIHRLTKITKGIDSSTGGWDGEHLTLRKLTVLDELIEPLGGTGSWVQLTPLLNSYSDVLFTWNGETPKRGVWYEKTGRYVTVSLGVSSGTRTGFAAIAGPLPAGNRPLTVTVFPIAFGTTFGLVMVDTAGYIRCALNAAGDIVGVIRFPVDL